METRHRQSSVTCLAVLVVVSGIPMIVFSVLSRGRSLLHLSVLEALYIRKLDPELCVQKENVLSLQLLALFVVRNRSHDLLIFSLFFLSLRFCHLLDLHTVFLTLHIYFFRVTSTHNWSDGSLNFFSL